MHTRNCPVKNGKSCRECGGKSFLRDRKGIEFPVRCTNGFPELFKSRPIYMADRMSEVKNADFVLLEFTTEDKEQISSVLKALSLIHIFNKSADSRFESFNRA